MLRQKATPQMEQSFLLLTGQTSSDTKGFCKPTLLIMSGLSFSWRLDEERRALTLLYATDVA